MPKIFGAFITMKEYYENSKNVTEKMPNLKKNQVDFTSTFLVNFFLLEPSPEHFKRFRLRTFSIDLVIYFFAESLIFLFASFWSFLNILKYFLTNIWRILEACLPFYITLWVSNSRNFVGSKVLYVYEGCIFSTRFQTRIVLWILSVQVNFWSDWAMKRN